MAPTDPRPCTAIILAGRRPGTDPLAAHFGLPLKALVPVAGKPMLARVAETLIAHPAIGRIIVISQDHDAFSAIGVLADERVTFTQGGDSVSAALADALGEADANYPALVTTADNVLLDEAMITYFITKAQAEPADLAVALVEKRVLEAVYPGNRRTWLRFRGGAYSGANLFWFANANSLRVLNLWRRIEQERKRGKAVIGAFGPLMLAAVGLRLATLHQALRWAGRRLGVQARAVELPMAEACIDIDGIGDHRLAEQIIAARP